MKISPLDAFTVAMIIFVVGIAAGWRLHQIVTRTMYHAMRNIRYGSYRRRRR